MVHLNEDQTTRAKPTAAAALAMIGILAVLLIAFYIVWAICQFTGPPKLAQVALIVLLGIVVFVLSGLAVAL